MIEKLEAEASADSTKKAYCDKELAESNAKKADKSDEIAALSTKLEQMSAKSAQLKEEVASLENELSKLSKSQADMDKMRSEEHSTFVANKAELEKGLEGLKAALKVLNEYYAKDGDHTKSSGSAGGIISLLEVCESDFTKGLAEITTEEEAAAAEYDQVSKENEIEKTTKDQDVKYKTKAAKALDKTSAETSSDRNGVQAELDAVAEYLARIEDECIAKAESYSERAARREAEIAGLKEALQTLESETALLQRRVVRKLRGAARPQVQVRLAVQ